MSINLSAYILPSQRKFWWNSLLVIPSLFKSSYLKIKIPWFYIQLQFGSLIPISLLQILFPSWFNSVSCLIDLHEDLLINVDLFNSYYFKELFSYLIEFVTFDTSGLLNHKLTPSSSWAKDSFLLNSIIIQVGKHSFLYLPSYHYFFIM